MPQVYSIFERIGLGGGGKVKAVYHRMNALAEVDGCTPILLNLDHSPKQKMNFAELQANGTIAPEVQFLTLPEACHRAAVDAGISPVSGFPAFDDVVKKGSKTEYRKDGSVVMVERAKSTNIGKVAKRTVTDPEGDLVYTLVDGQLHQLVQRRGDGTVDTMDYAGSLPIRWERTRNREFVIGKNLVTDTICRMKRVYVRNIFEMMQWNRAVVFFDGVTSAYLSEAAEAQRVLFLHADHRSPTGSIVPRSKFLIENFKGEAIVTSTDVHKVQIEADVTPAADVHVIPHFCETSDAGFEGRKNLVTVSRLELVGKPIHECIEAFCEIKDAYPDVDYLIYGVGAGQPQLEALIAELGCADRVRLEGYTTDPLSVFRNAVASVYPTMTEGFGLSILEALSNGCPVITYDVNYGPRETIVSGQNGELVDPGDIPAIAAAIRRVLETPERYHHGTRQGLERYSRQAYVANYSAIIDKLLAEYG